MALTNGVLAIKRNIFNYWKIPCTNTKRNKRFYVICAYRSWKFQL